MSVRLPDVLWAQRKPHVFLTIAVPNVRADTAKIELTEDSLHFTGTGGVNAESYEVTVPFYKSIDLEKSTQAVKARGVYFLLIKKEEEWWPRLLKEGKARNIKVDWENYKDEDEADENEAMPNDFDMSQFANMGGMPGMGGMDMSQFGNLGGMPGMGGMDMSQFANMGGMPGMEHDHDHDHDHEHDSDDEEIPNLEDNEEEEEKKEEKKEEN